MSTDPRYHWGFFRGCYYLTVDGRIGARIKAPDDWTGPWEWQVGPYSGSAGTLLEARLLAERAWRGAAGEETPPISRR